MEAKKLIEAAEIIQAQYHETSDTEKVIAALKIAEHIIATMREDDGDAITVEWHRENRPGTGKEGLTFNYNGRAYYWQSWGYELPDGFTRGQLRQLLAALGGGT